MRANGKQNDDSEFSRLIRRAQAEPFNGEAVQAFYDAYAGQEQQSDDAKMVYLMLRCIRDGFRSEWLKELAQIHIGRKEFFIGFMCLADSLRLNPMQPEDYEQLQKLSEYQQPKMLEPSDSFDCTVSVIMTTLNRLIEIREAIQSVLAQTFDDYELLIVNDGGSDEAEKAVNSFGSDKIRYIGLENNIGHYAATNLALEQSRGKYIAYLDDDDVYYPKHLERLVRVLENNPYRLAYTNTKAVEGQIRDGKFVKERDFWHWRQEYSRDKLAEKTFVTNTTIMHHRNLLCETGLFNEEIVSEDWEMWLRMALKTDFVHLDIFSCEYRFRNDNTCKKNLHEVHFSGKLVSNYHKYHQGKIACAKYYLALGDIERAEQLYEAVKSDYETGFRTADLIEELLDFATRFEDRDFLKRLSRDYFKRAPKECLKKVAHTKSATMLASVLPSVPLWVVKALPRKTLSYGKKVARKGLRVIGALSRRLQTQF